MAITREIGVSVIKPSEEIKAFKCPVCGKILEFKDGSKEYITVNGNLTWGESVIFIGDSIENYSQKNPCRICTHCLSNILIGENHRNPFADLFGQFAQHQLGSAFNTKPKYDADEESQE